MEEQWLVDRARLRELMSDHADWAHRQFAEEVGRSVGWVKKWRKRLREASPDDDTILYGLSRARKHPPASISREVVDRILEIRDNPPESLKRIPGPLTILYYLHKDENLKASGAVCRVRHGPCGESLMRLDVSGVSRNHPGSNPGLKKDSPDHRIGF